MSARTTLPMDLNIELPMPALVRTYSASSTDSDSSPPTTPTSADYSSLGRPFDEIDTTKKQVVAHTGKKSFTSPRRRTVATSVQNLKQKEQDALPVSAMQVIFLICMLFVDALRIVSWIPICLRIIFKEVWIVIECELKSRDVDPECVKRAFVAVLVLVVCYCMFL